MGRLQELARVVVTGRGAVTPLGIGARALWEGLVAGRSGVVHVPALAGQGIPVEIAGVVPDFDVERYVPRKEARRMARFTHFALAAAEEAIADAGLELEREDRTRIGVEMGNAVGSVDTTLEQQAILQAEGPRRLVPTVIPGAMINMAACQVAMRWGLQGPGGAPVAACATGLYAVGDAFRRLQRGEADVMIAGACESFLHPLAIAAFWRIGALSTRNDDPAGAARPFAADRDGTVLGEGAAVLVLETEAHARARGTTVLGEIIGYGQSMDAFHLIMPDEQGNGAARAMRLALADAMTPPDAVDWIAAHGTATPLNDLAEARAIQSVFGTHVACLPISGLKAATGHLLGAAGAVNVLASLEAIRTGTLPPTLNLHHPDPALGLDFVPLVARHHPVRVALSNAFGIGGQNAALVIQRYEP